MNPQDSMPPTSDADRAIDRRVRRTLVAAGSDPSVAVESVMRRIDGRTPRAVAESVVAGRLRAGSAVAAAVLMGLSFFDRDTSPSIAEPTARPDDVSVLALSDPDADREGRRTRPSDVVLEIFDLELEVPQ